MNDVRHSRSEVDRRLADAVERLGHGLRGLAQQTARAENLTPLQQHVLLAVRRQPPVRREVGAIAADLEVAAPTVSDAVAALHRKGLVDRVVGVDARRRELILTEEGGAVADRLDAWDEPLRAALGRVDVADKGVALDLLLTVMADLAADGTIGVARTCTSCRFFRRDAHRTGAPHHCGLLDLPLPRAELRVECPEHQPAA